MVITFFKKSTKNVETNVSRNQYKHIIKTNHNNNIFLGNQNITWKNL